MAGMSHRPFKRQFSFCLVLALFFLEGAVAITFAAAITREEAQNILNESMVALLTGKEIDTSLAKRQLALREALQTGAIKKTELKAMLERIALPILNQHKTSRYILKTLPEKFDELVSPYMEWHEAEEIMWRACSSVIKEGQKFELKLGTLAPKGTPWLVIPETELLPKIEKLSNGKVVIKVYGGGVMGEDSDILRKMDIGQLDGCGCTALGILAASPEASVFLLPGLFNSYDEVDYIFEKFRERLDTIFEKRGYILASLIDTGFFHVFSKNKISSLADMKKQRIITWFGIAETAIYDELDIKASPIAVPEVISAFSTGLADTAMAPATWLLGMQAYQYVNYYLTMPLLYSPAAIFVSTQTKARFCKQFGLSELLANNFVELLVFEVSTLEDDWKKQVRSFDKKSLEAFEVKCGIKPVTLSPEDRQVFEQAAKRVSARLAGNTFSEDFMHEILNSLAEYRARRPNR